jgi:NodT family efflux transporter outer membrane factor (OMF) lipoprotein
MAVYLNTVFGGRAEPGGLALAVIIWLLLWFSGCTVGPDYVRPKTATPDTYKEMSGWKVAQPLDSISRGVWWQIYNDPQLNALEQQVDINNQNIAAAEANFRQALALIRIARAAYFPAVTGGTSWSRFRNSANLGTGSQGGGASTTGISGTSASGGGFGAFRGLTQSNLLMNSDVSWELDLWGLVRRNVESSLASAQASAADLEGIRLSAQATLAQHYFLLRSLDSQRQLLDDTVAAYQKILDLTKNRYAMGVASKGDVLQAETQVKSTKAQAIDLGVQRAQLEHAIALLLGKPASTFSIPKAPLTAHVPPIPFGVPSELLERRPDIASAERRMAAANAQVGVAIAAYYPTVTLSASGGFQASEAAKWFLWPSRFWSLGAAAAQTIFQGGALVAQTDAARATYDANVASYRQTVLTGFQEVEDNLAALRILGEEEKVQSEAVRAAQGSLRVSTNQYRAGTINHLDLLVVETIALNNERTAITIRGNRMSASVLLIKALGGGWKASDLPEVASRLPESPKRAYGSDRPAQPERPPSLKVAEDSANQKASGAR